MKMSDDGHVFDALPALALGSLDEEEARLVRAHIEVCTLCRSEAASFEGVTGRLALALPQAVPSSRVKTRLMRSLSGGRREVTTTRRAPAPRWALALLGAAVLILAVANLSLWAVLRNQQMLTGPQGMRAIALQSTDFEPGSSGFVLIGADGRNGALVVDNLPQLNEAQEYQVWLHNQNGFVSAALFAVDEYGYRGARINAPENLLSYDEITITIEPKGGSPVPTGPEVLRGTLQKR